MGDKEGLFSAIVESALNEMAERFLKNQEAFCRLNSDEQATHMAEYAAVALTRDKTILMIAHRLKTVRRADLILVVDQGRIVQRGTPEQLISRPASMRISSADAGKPKDGRYKSGIKTR